MLVRIVYCSRDPDGEEIENKIQRSRCAVIYVCADSSQLPDNRQRVAINNNNNNNDKTLFLYSFVKCPTRG